MVTPCNHRNWKGKIKSSQEDDGVMEVPVTCVDCGKTKVDFVDAGSEGVSIGTSLSILYSTRSELKEEKGIELNGKHIAFAVAFLVYLVYLYVNS